MMKRTLFALALLLATHVCAQDSLHIDTALCPMAADSILAPVQPIDSASLSPYHADLPQPKHPWRAAAETAGLNVFVWSFDRAVLNMDCSHISFKTMGDNFKTGFVWDNDQFSTNLFAHPYHGNLYFNAARSNGLNFWQSVPYACAGSLMWEFLGENEPPAINDFLATSIGGTALGEMMHRMSGLVLDDSKRGGARVWREAVGLLINPMQGLNRLITGDMWRVRSHHHLYHNYDTTPIDFSVGLGYRYLGASRYFFHGEQTPYIDIMCNYGDIFDAGTHPYDVFQVKAMFGVSGSQPLIDRVNITGKLLTREKITPYGLDVVYGLFQHFNYFDSQPVIDGTNNIPYRVSEAASLGPGVIYRLTQRRAEGIDLQQSIYGSAIILGSSLSDYFTWIDRDYNMGSGFSIKSITDLKMGRHGHFLLNLYSYHLYTWKGYSQDDLDKYEQEPLYLNVQGDRSRVWMFIVNPLLRINLNEHFRLQFEANYFSRNTRYKYHDNVTARTIETKMGMVYQF